MKFRVNANIPTGKRGVYEKKPGTLLITAEVLEFRYRVLFDKKTYRILRSAIVSADADKPGLGTASLQVATSDGKTATFKMSRGHADQALNELIGGQSS